jgi:Major Facilitator Superfamily
MSLCLGGIFSILFGLANHYFLALFLRFCMGLFCDAASLTKTLVSEMAGDNRKREAATMNMVVSAWAVGSLLAPALGGALADPVHQYPDFFVLGSLSHQFLNCFPYFLPNLVGAVLCLGGVVVTKLYLTETLVLEQREIDTERQSLVKNTTRLTTFDAMGDADSFVICPEVIEMAHHQDMHDMMRDSYLWSDDLEGVMTSSEFRLSMAVSIYRGTSHRNLANTPSKRQFISEGDRSVTAEDGSVQELDEEPTKPVITNPTTLTFLLDPDTRNHLIVYCIGCFIICFHMEAFPLFCLSHNAGLGVSERTIGAILLASGITHILLQPSIYGRVFAKSGLKGSIRLAATFLIPIFLLIPFSLLGHKEGDDHLRWTALTFLGVVVGLGRTFTVTFVSSMSVSLNHLVDAHHRATFNGLLTRIAGGCKSAAPIMAGFFVAWVFTSDALPSHELGAVLLYLSLGVGSIILTAASHVLLGEDEQF